MGVAAARITAFLEEQGHRAHPTPTASPDITTIAFRTRGPWFTAITNESDPTFLRLIGSLPFPPEIRIGIGSLESLLRIQDRLKCVKFSAPAPDAPLTANVELLLDREDAFAAVFWRAISLVETGLLDAAHALREQSEVKSAADKFLDEFVNGDAP